MNKTVRLDIRDLPRDLEHYQGQLRTQLIKMANYVRKYPNKAPALLETLDFVKTHVEKNIALDAVVEEVAELVVEAAPVKKVTKKEGK